MRTHELIDEAKKKVEIFDQEIENVLLEEDEGAKKVAIAILEFANLLEEVYIRIIKRETSKRVQHHQMLKELKYCNVSEELLYCLGKMKQFRNRIAHAAFLENPVSGYFNKDTEGLEKVIKIRNRMNIILKNAKEDSCYAYVYVA